MREGARGGGAEGKDQKVNSLNRAEGKNERAREGAERVELREVVGEQNSRERRV